MERWTAIVLRRRWAVLGTWVAVFAVAGWASAEPSDLSSRAR